MTASTRTVGVALVAGLGVTLAKVVAAVVTSSPAMAAEASHSLADTANDLFLLVAQRRSAHPPDERHPFGYGREAYFWALIAALGVFIGGAAFSLRAGITELIHPTATSSFIAAYVVLGVSTVFDLASFRQSAHQMSVVSIAGDVFALAGLALSQITGSSTPQAVAAVLIALVLIRVSLRLVSQNHDFLLGQPVPASDRDRVEAFLLGHTGVSAVRELLVTYIGPDQVWVLARITIRQPRQRPGDGPRPRPRGRLEAAVPVRLPGRRRPCRRLNGR